MNDLVPTRFERPSSPALAPVLSAGDVLAIGSRHRRAIILTFFAIFSVLSVVLLAWPWPYRSELRLLVRQERVNPIVTTDDTPRPVAAQGITEQDLNSEVELIKSHDLLQRVVSATGLHERPASWIGRLSERIFGRASGPAAATLRLERATLALQEGLSVEPINKTSLIRVSYDSPDAQLSSQVLKVLSELYLQKHLELRRPAGMLDFLDKETERSLAEFDAVKAQVAQFRQSNKVPSVIIERDAVLKEVSDLTQTLSQTDAELAAAAERTDILQRQLAKTPARTSTESREASARLQETQRAKLLDLELKRVELARVFQSTYPPLVEVEQQLAATRAAIALAERAPIREEATDVNPTFEWLSTELAKAQSELGALKARQSQLRSNLATARDRGLVLEALLPQAHDLERDLKVAEDNYLSYQRKREEARMSNALDTRGIVNVAVSDAPTVPFKPARPSRVLLLLIAGVAAVVGGLGVGFVADVLNPAFRSPDEVYALMHVPVISASSVWETADSPARRLTDGS